MNRSKKLTILLGVLVFAVAATVCLSFFKERTEQIKNSGETVLQISPDTVDSLSWEYEGDTLSFHKADKWLWDGDEAFPVDQEKIAGFLSRFENFSVSFIIENVEDFGQYGLDSPTCTVDLTAGGDSWEIKLGDFSKMDSKRYVSIGDGNVYLVDSDPLDDYDAVLSDMIDNDDIPTFEKTASVKFSGKEEYELYRDESGDSSVCADDVYFTESDGRTLPLDTSLVDGYLANISMLDTGEYVTYNATDAELAEYGLDEPELTVEAGYSYTGEDGKEQDGSFTLHISRDPKEEPAEDEEDEDITAYARVGQSRIVYKIPGGSYKLLMAASVDDLRHKELFTAGFDALTGIDVSLEGESYAFVTEGSGGDKTWSYGEEELDTAALSGSLTALEAEEFTTESPSGQLEIGLTLHLDSEKFPTLTVELYRYDGEHCLAVLDGTPTALIPRSQAVDLIEAVHAVVLGNSE